MYVGESAENHSLRAALLLKNSEFGTVLSVIELSEGSNRQPQAHSFGQQHGNCVSSGQRFIDSVSPAAPRAWLEDSYASTYV